MFWGKKWMFLGEGLSGDLILTENDKHNPEGKWPMAKNTGNAKTGMRESLKSYRNREIQFV